MADIKCLALPFAEIGNGRHEMSLKENILNSHINSITLLFLLFILIILVKGFKYIKKVKVGELCAV